MDPRNARPRLDDTVRGLLAEYCEIAPETITPNTSLRELGLDSIAMLNLMLEVEDRLGVKLVDPRLPASPCLEDLMGMVERHLEKE